MFYATSKVQNVFPLYELDNNVIIIIIIIRSDIYYQSITMLAYYCYVCGKATLSMIYTANAAKVGSMGLTTLDFAIEFRSDVLGLMRLLTSNQNCSFN